MQNRNSKVKNGTSASLVQNGLLAEVPGGLNDLACAIYERNVEKGFYEKPKKVTI